MKKSSIFPILLIALGVLAIIGVTLGFHSYTDDIFVHVATGEPVEPDWRAFEFPMHLDTMQLITAIAALVSFAGVVLFLIGHSKDIRRQDIIGILFVALGMLTILGILSDAFYPCGHTMPASPRPMRCVWTMRTLFAVAGMVGLSGVLMLAFRRSREIALGLNLAGLLASVVFLLIPTAATGVCTVHQCVYGFAPFSRVMGGLMIAFSLFALFLLRKREDYDDEISDNF